jgi:hypothetical protein
MRTLLALLGLAFLISSPAAAQDKKVKRQANVITSEEIDAIRGEATDAYAIVQRLRPQFFRVRGMVEVDPARRNEYHGPKVIVDGTPRGDLDALKQVSAAAVKEIRYLTASDASTSYGTGYDGGAIVVTTR